jgi:hypothetical protein
VAFIPRLYWDACCFIRVCEPYDPRNPGGVTPEEYDALLKTFEDLRLGRVFIACCDIFDTEILEAKMSASARAVYNQLVSCPNFDKLPIHSRGSEAG